MIKVCLCQKQWAENIIKTGEFEFDPKIPEIGENLYRGEILDSDFIVNYNPYLDAVTYWATNRKGDGVSFENMSLSDLIKQEWVLLMETEKSLL